MLRPLGEAATKAAILTFTGLSVTVAFRVGLFNIGAQGQLVVGALAAAVVGAKVEAPAWIHLPLCLLAAAVAGALYALGPALLKLKRGVHEVISTIMLNWVAVSLVDNWLVTGPLRAATTGDNSISGTDQIQPTAELPRLLGESSRLNLGIVLALIAAILTWVFLTRFTRGFEWKAIGLSQDAARAVGHQRRPRLPRGDAAGRRLRRPGRARCSSSAPSSSTPPPSAPPGASTASPWR